MAATVGQPAPGFTLKDQDNNEVSVDDLKGHKALVVFIPFPFTGICTGELCAIRDHLNTLSDLDAKVVVITCDTRFVHKKWADEEGFTFPILSDFWPHGATAQAYGAFNDTTGSANRVTYVLDADGVVREIIDSGSLGTPREYELYEAALAKI
jgi:peroxiredoxin (alkyl hydroperoxide reductase subunit C)